ncbi:MAG: hypothetical protein AAF664_19575, partial [Planctomycetota bacterium]
NGGTSQNPTRKDWLLFDLEKDPSEKTNLAGQHEGIVKDLRVKFTSWFEEVTAGQSFKPVAIPVTQSSTVLLAPSWAEVNGPNIQYVFDGYDWDTIESWKHTDDRCSWTLDVQDPGLYEIRISYGCAPKNAGRTLTIGFDRRSSTDDRESIREPQPKRASVRFRQERRASAQSADRYSDRLLVNASDSIALKYDVDSTATANQFSKRVVGTVQLSAGAVTLYAHPSKNSESELCRLNHVELVPVANQ